MHSKTQRLTRPEKTSNNLTLPTLFYLLALARRQKPAFALRPLIRLVNRSPFLGVCLGHQAIGAAFGATVTRAKYPMHGKASFIQHNDEGLFKNLPNPLKVARYHSLIVLNDSPELVYTAFSSEGEVMALQHKKYPIYRGTISSRIDIN